MTDTATCCPSCGQLNHCAQATVDAAVSQCWCFSVTVNAQQLANLPPEQRNRSCLCPRCAQGLPPASLDLAD